MSRLYGVDYDRDHWNVTGDRGIGYRILNKDTNELYRITGDVIGIEQVSGSANRFLIYKRYTRDEWLFMSVRFECNNIIKEYIHKFTEFCFLSENTIAFDLNQNACTVVYNIDTNKESAPLSHYFSPDEELYDIRFYQNRKIEMICEKENEYPSYLLLTYNFSSYIIDIGATLQFVVDPVSYQIVSPVYSGLWEKFITIDDDETMEDIACEHYIETRRISDFLRNFYGKNSSKKIEDFLEVMQ